MGDVHRFGVARESERMHTGSSSSGRSGSGSSGGGAGLGILAWLAMSDYGPGGIWHRVQCRRGRHEMAGGLVMQLGSEFVTVERRCRWCDAQPTGS